MSSVTAADVRVLVERLNPFDDVEAEHQSNALGWLGSTDDIFRRTPPKTPPKHLVAYFLLLDPADGAVLLVLHRKAGLWLPTGGHVEVGEHPVATVRREAREELGVAAVLARAGDRPLFITVTETRGDPDSRHTDVSLWYLLKGSRDDVLHPDEREFAATRWWSRTEVDAAEPRILEPHLRRFLIKVDAAG